MLKISKYITVSMFFIIVFILFLAFNPDSHQINPDSEPTDVIIKADGPVGVSEEKIAVVIDDISDKKIDQFINLTLSYLHQDYVVCDSLYDVGKVGTIIIATPSITDSEIEPLTAFLAEGGNVIFAVLPDTMTEELMALLGITEFTPGYRALGFDIYEGILLDGMYRSEKLRMDCAKVALSGKCKTFANGHDPKRDKSSLVLDPETENPLIWRIYHGDGVLFALNAPFLEDASGMGILTGLLALSTEDFIYPVIGTRSVILDNFPYIDNSDVSVSGRTYDSFIRDIMWPDFVSLSKHSDITYTCYMNGHITNDSTVYDTLTFLNTELYKTQNGELGFSFRNGTSLVDYEKDFLFMNNYFPSFTMQSFQLPSETDISGAASIAGATSFLTTDWSQAFGWVTNQSILLPVTSSGIEDEYTSLMYSSVASMLGLVVHRIDMEPIFTGETAWNDYSRGMQGYISYLFEKFTFLQPSSVRQTAEATKDYLNLKMKVMSDEQAMKLSLSNNNKEISFLLRTNKKIDVTKCVNCSVTNIEEDVYLITSSENNLVIGFEKVE